MNVSSAKSEANRRNAAKSTGPRTPGGKLRSRMNAQRHGLTATTALLLDPTSMPMELKALLTRLREEYQPETIGELVHVETIAVAIYRLRRAHKFEFDMFDRQKRFYPDVLAGLDRYTSSINKQLNRSLDALRESQLDADDFVEESEAEAAQEEAAADPRVDLVSTVDAVEQTKQCGEQPAADRQSHILAADPSFEPRDTMREQDPADRDSDVLTADELRISAD